MTLGAAIASVTQSGNVTGQGEGTAIIYAAAGGFRDSAFITVYPDTGWIIQVSNATEDLYGVFFQPDGRVTDFRGEDWERNWGTAEAKSLG